MTWLAGPYVSPLPSVAKILKLDGLCGHPRPIQITLISEPREHSYCGVCGSEWFSIRRRGT